MSEDTLAIVTSLLTNDTTNIVELSTAEFTAYMVVGIPSWILYILVIIVLIKPSNQIVFGNSYYRLVVAIGLLDILLYIIFNLEFRFPLYAPIAKLYVEIPDRSFFLQFIFFAAYFLRYFKGCLVLATSLNRLTSVVAYMSHEKIWEYGFIISLAGGVVTASSLSWYYFFGRIAVVPMDFYEVTYGLAPIVDLFPANSAAKLALFGLVCGSLDLVINVITCTVIFLKRNQNVIFNKIVLGLMMVTLVEFVTQILMFAAQGGLYILGVNHIFDGIYNDFYFAMCWITDLNTLLKPYMLLLMSGAVKERFLSAYWRKCGKNMMFRSVSSKVQVF